VRKRGGLYAHHQPGGPASGGRRNTHLEVLFSMIPHKTSGMKKLSLTYRLAGLALVLSVVLGSGLPSTCQVDLEAASGSGHSTVPCTAPCHTTKAPAKATSPLAVASHFATDSDASPSPSAAFTASIMSGLVPPTPYHISCTPRQQRRLCAPSVRLHVVHAVFLD
jgi:hypothetical protein